MLGYRSPVDSRNLLTLSAALGLALALAGPAAAECPADRQRLKVPDPARLTLAEGEHVIAAARTDAGTLEARVSVKGEGATAPRLYLDGAPLHRVAEDELPASARQCLNDPEPEAGALTKAASALADWLMPTAHAQDCSEWIFTLVECFYNNDGSRRCIYTCRDSCGRHCGVYQV